jgi:putative transposase
MPDFRRYYIQNSIVFITNVTRERAPYLRSKENIDLLWETLHNVKKIHPFNLLAYVILHDHFHWLMYVEGSDGDFSRVMHSVKRNFTLNYKKLHEIDSPLNIWQKRYWDHIIRDEYDLSRHIDYIHWNPVNHGYVLDPIDWHHSSYLHWVRKGYYPEEWGKSGKPADILDMNFE